MIFEPSYWWWESVLPEKLCDLIISEGDSLISGDGRIGSLGTGNGTYDQRIRETNISFFESGHWVEALCTHYATIANRNSGWNLNTTHPQNVQYARYFPDQHYTPHRDDSIKRTENGTMRKLSVSIQISDPNTYEGGDFIIQTGNNEEYELLHNYRKRGSVIVFPSIVKHGVHPVTKGVRHSVVCWIAGAKFQ